MGIPKFFKWVCNRFGKSIIKQYKLSQKLPSVPSIECLYLDCNGIIHSCVKAELEKGPLSLHKKPVNIPNIYKAITDYIDTLTKFTGCSLVYIAIDGVAPVAKQFQQRQRRYKSVVAKSQEEIDRFDTNCITPGTKFMTDLNIYIRNFIKNKKTNDWKNIKVLYSDSSVPGEGEHKLMNYIRSHPEISHLNHCVYGLDADLFMLSLLTHVQQISLLREDMFADQLLFNYVDLAVLRDIMCKEYAKPQENNIQFINEFVLLSFLLGNDFLHNLPAFHDLEDSIEYLLQKRKVFKYPIVDTSKASMKEAGTRGTSVTTTRRRPEGEINITNLKKFFKSFCKEEANLIRNQLFGGSLQNTRVLNSLTSPDVMSELDLNKYRDNLLKFCECSDIQQICQDYLKSLVWTWYYYNGKLIDCQHCYKYHASVLLTDLAEFKHTPIVFEHNSPLTIEQQLLCVIPPQSYKLLTPEQSNKQKQFPQYYPLKFEIDLEGKSAEWQGTALLPFIDIKKLLLPKREQ